MTDPLVLSASSLATFLRCGQQWYYAYVEGVKSPPSVRQVIGIAAHKAIEVNMSQKIDTMVDLPADSVLDAYSDSFDTEIYGWEPVEGEETPAEGKDSGADLVSFAYEHVLPPIQPFLVEEPVQFRVRGIPYSGTIDLADTKGRIMDWKTSKRRPANTAGLHILQMTGYALGYRMLTDQVENEVVLQHLIRTKLPQYLPVASGGPVSNAAVNTFANIVVNVHDQIQAGNFVPNGLMSGACSWCGYQDICPAYREFRHGV